MMVTPDDCPMIQGDRRVNDKWRETVESRFTKLDESIRGNAEALRNHALKHEALVQTTVINNAQTQRMYDIFVPVENAFLLISKVYNGTVKVANVVVALLKPLIFIVLVIIAVVTYFKTGHWEFNP